jgi:hypothetical protein
VCRRHLGVMEQGSVWGTKASRSQLAFLPQVTRGKVAEGEELGSNLLHVVERAGKQSSEQRSQSSNTSGLGASSVPGPFPCA